jgi:hypothetical protein
MSKTTNETEVWYQVDFSFTKGRWAHFPGQMSIPTLKEARAALVVMREFNSEAKYRIRRITAEVVK